MGCDMVVAGGPATVGGQTLFGLNFHRPYGECAIWERVPGRPYELGQTVHTTCLDIPQARQTFTVLGCRTQDCWGFQHGLNEHQLAIGCASWQSRLEGGGSRLLGTDLVRLALERCKSAQQAVDLVTDLIARHGQGRTAAKGEEQTDSILLFADPTEAFVVEAAGPYWAYLQCHDVRAVCDAAMIHQDWNRVSHGLAELAISKGWWHDDGSKIDFARSLRLSTGGEAGAMRRWGRATRHLQQQNGHIDTGFLRRLLGDHFEETSGEVQPMLARPGSHIPLCRHARIPGQVGTCASFVAELGSNRLSALAWVAAGPPCASVYFPIFVAGALPEGFSHGQSDPDSLWWKTHQLISEFAGESDGWSTLQHAMGHLQERFDREAEEFLQEAMALKERGEEQRIGRLAGLLMQNHVEQYEAELQRLRPSAAPAEIGTAAGVGQLPG